MCSLRMKTLLFSIFFIISTVTAHLNLKHVKCLVCRIIVDEFEEEVNQLDPKKKIEIGQYRLDPAGNMIHKKVPMTMSEVHLSEMLDDVCKKMEDYVRARYKSNNKLTILKLMTSKGLNPLLREVDIIQDGDLNKSLEYFCEDVVNANEDAFIKVMSSKDPDAKVKICTEIADYCTEFGDDLGQHEPDEYTESTEIPEAAASTQEDGQTPQEDSQTPQEDRQTSQENEKTEL